MRKDSVSREVLRHKEFEGSVQLRRIRDWFICTSILSVPCTMYGADVYFRIVNVESEGPYAPERLFLESIKVMRDKIATIKAAAEGLMANADAEPNLANADGDVEMGEA